MFLSFALCLSAQAQKRSLTLDEMFRLADENNKALRTNSIGVQAAQEGLFAAKSGRLPDINASLSASYIGNGYLWDRNFGNGMPIDMPHFGNNFSLQVAQVIYAGGALNSGIALADLGVQMAQLQHEQKRQEVHFLLAGHYLDLFKLGNQIRIFDQNIALTEKMLDDIRNRQAQGMALKNDITRYELQLENLKMQRTRLLNGKEILNYQLTNAIGWDTSVEIEPDSTLIHNILQTISENDWQQSASQNAPALRQLDLVIRMNEEKEKLAQSARRPKLALVGEEHLDGPILIEVPVINKNFNYWFVGLGLQYDLSSLYKSSHDIRKARLEVQRSQEEKTVVAEGVDNGVHAVFVQYQEAVKNLEICEKTLALANENYRMTRNRYDNELALLTDMLDASNSKLSAELEWVNAKISIYYYYLNLHYLTGKL
ncbi:MAG: TolC family protein [Bacteroidales bacterium]|nr:TolC family protein [Bacteroidales bacterium]